VETKSGSSFPPEVGGDEENSIGAGEPLFVTLAVLFVTLAVLFVTVAILFVSKRIQSAPRSLSSSRSPFSPFRRESPRRR